VKRKEKNNPKDEEETGSCSSCYEGKHIKGAPTSELIDRHHSHGLGLGVEGGKANPSANKRRRKKKRILRKIYLYTPKSI
jgi:hypothetical protein